MWPANRKAFWEYWDTMINSFTITSHAISVSKDLLYNKKIPFLARINIPLLRLITADWLPPQIREAYGLKTLKSRRATYRVVMGFTRSIYPQLPMTIWEYPMKYYMADMRHRMKNIA
jgi:uncharacterized protein (DUF2236 family)